MLTLPSICSDASVISLWIVTDNEIGIIFDVLGDYLGICGTISILNCYPVSPLNKEFLYFNIIYLIVFRNSHENMVLHATTSLR